MPELPDLTVAIEGLRDRLRGQRLERIEVLGPSLLRSVDPPLSSCAERRVEDVRRLGKRIVIVLEEELFLVLHLRVAGRLRWRPRGRAPRGRAVLARLEFDAGVLSILEHGRRKRATLHVVRGEAALREHDPGGLEVLEADLARFRSVLRRETHTLKRALTDPHILSGIGNAYSDEILHRACLSPVQRTDRLRDDEIERLYRATRSTLEEWTERLRREAGGELLERMTAFRDGMAVHGRFREPCPRCGAPIQRIVYAEHETNYCARCQTGGRLLADRALSRLLRGDWPRRLEDLESRRPRRG